MDSQRYPNIDHGFVDFHMATTHYIMASPNNAVDDFAKYIFVVRIQMVSRRMTLFLFVPRSRMPLVIYT